MTANTTNRTRRRWRAAAWVLAGIVATTALADRAGLFGYRGDDWKRFHQRDARCVQVHDGESFTADVGGTRITVRLIGIDAPDTTADHWFEPSKQYLIARLKDRTFLLRLDGTQTRDQAGRLFAYVYITDNDCLNIDAIRDGQAFADRRVRHSLKSVMEQNEADPRKKGRGMWKDLGDEMQPEWRRQWLKSLRSSQQP